jgi:hypothetical protein
MLAYVLPSFAVYAVLGALLDFRYESYLRDTQGRLANAFYVFFSRDPHAAAIGFVWNPLSSVSMMPLLFLKDIWPGLVTRAYAANLMSAVFMAASVWVLHEMLREFGVRRGARIALTVCFALHPMMVVYGASGMSEALFIYTLMLACRRLARWIEGRQTWDLALGGAAMGFSYLTRNEAVAPAFVATLVVFGLTMVRTPSDLRTKAVRACVSSFVFAAPAFFAFWLWAVMSWVIVGHPFEAFSNAWGTANRLAASGDYFESTRGGLSNPAFLALQLLGLAPLLLPALAAACWTGFRFRDARVLAALTVPGGVVLFAVVGFLAGQEAGWLRYQILVVPTMFVVAGCALARPARPARPVQRLRWVRGSAALLIAASVGLVSMGTAALTIADTRLGHEEHDLVLPLFKPDADYQFKYRQRTAEGITAYLDAKHLPRGSVIMDTGSPCVSMIVLATHDPKQFVITNDRDFKPILADPALFRAKYLLVPHNAGIGGLNAINRAFPTMYESGAGIAELEHEFTDSGCPTYRLYRVKPASNT